MEKESIHGLMEKYI
jgi:hypothetical protein